MDAGGDPSWSPAALAIAIAAGTLAALLAGLLTALRRVRGLHQHELLDAAAARGALGAYLDAPRRFEITLGTLYLACTMVGAVAAARAAGAERGLPAAGLAAVAFWSLGGMAARRLAAGDPLSWARWGARCLMPAQVLLTPWNNLLVWLLGHADAAATAGRALPPPLTSGEIRSLLSGEEEAVDLEAGEREMIHSIFGFHDTAVREIMVPRIDMVTLAASDSIEAAVATVNATLHSRIPVHDGTVDRVTGLLYAKDLLALVEEGRLVTRGKTVGDLERPAYFIPESKKIDEVLAEFRHNRIHMAIVIDEYGGTAGLVTMEDVLEEIVGEIEDEFDDQERLYEWIDERTVRVEPKIDLEDLQELLGMSLPAEEGSETLAGLVYEAAGRVPEVGDVFEIGGLSVTVEEVEDQRILRVRVVSSAPLPGWVARAGRKD